MPAAIRIPPLKPLCCEQTVGFLSTRLFNCVLWAVVRCTVVVFHIALLYFKALRLEPSTLAIVRL